MWQDVDSGGRKVHEYCCWSCLTSAGAKCLTSSINSSSSRSLRCKFCESTKYWRSWSFDIWSKSHWMYSAWTCCRVMAVMSDGVLILGKFVALNEILVRLFLHFKFFTISNQVEKSFFVFSELFESVTLMSCICLTLLIYMESVVCGRLVDSNLSVHCS